MEFEQTLQWSDRFLTGVVEIDDQHRILVGILNEAGFRLSRDGGVDYLEQVTSDLLSYAIYHFATEERLMLQYDYGDAWPEDGAAPLCRQLLPEAPDQIEVFGAVQPQVAVLVDHSAIRQLLA